MRERGDAEAGGGAVGVGELLGEDAEWGEVGGVGLGGQVGGGDGFVEEPGGVAGGGGGVAEPGGVGVGGSGDVGFGFGGEGDVVGGAVVVPAELGDGGGGG